MWLHALRTMPSVNSEQWLTLDIVSRWLIASRASVLSMTFASAAIGGLLAWGDRSFHLPYFILAVMGLLFAHACNNQINDFTDSKRGVDKDNYYRNRYGTHVLEDRLLTSKALLGYIVFTGLLAILCGALLTVYVGGATIFLMAAGALFVLFYTYPLKYIGLGEVAVLLCWGPLMIGGTFYVCAGYWSWPVAVLGLVYGLGPTAVLFGKHTDKIEVDKQKRIYSLPVILGPHIASRCTLLMLYAQYAGVLLLIAFLDYGWPLLLVFLNVRALPRVKEALSSARPLQRPMSFPEEVWPLWYSAYAFDYTRKFSGLLLLGLLIEGWA